MITRLVLASASPRRHALLAAAGVKFEIVESGIDETLDPDENASTYAERIARAKALHVSQRIPEAVVLGADTVVELRDMILLKPADASDARRMLRALAGETHTVVTAYAIARAGVLIESAPVTARVTFRSLSDDEIDSYVATGESFDKAGSYGIQGGAANFIGAVEGGRDTVMGLPVDAVLAALGRHGFDAI